MAAIVRVQEPKPINVLNDLPTNADMKTALIVLSSLVFRMQGNVMSGDVWALSYMAAMNDAEQLGVSEEEFTALMLKLEKSRLRERGKNPLHSMF